MLEFPQNEKQLAGTVSSKFWLEDKLLSWEPGALSFGLLYNNN